MLDDDDPQDGPGVLGRGVHAALTCSRCGWQGVEALAVARGPHGDPSTSSCPRCHEPLTGEMPSASEIAAARRAPAS